MVGICHRRIPTIEYNDDDDNDNEKTEQLISIHFNVDSPPLKITFFVRIAHGREVFERQDTILEIDQLGINMEDNIMSQRTELQKRTKKDDDI